MDKRLFEKVFSKRRMEKYFALYNDEQKAIHHYQCNLELAEAFYISLSVFEVTLRNALNRELIKFAGCEDWYTIFVNTVGLENLNHYVVQAQKQITSRKEQISPAKIVAELTLGFWVSLMNAEYTMLWKDLRKAFPNMPKELRQRKNISAPLNKFRKLRNRIFHNESICWKLNQIKDLHNDLIQVIQWMDKDIPNWLKEFDRFDATYTRLKKLVEAGEIQC